MNGDEAVVAFSHLRWDLLYQRPQHLLSRIAARRSVLFVEEAIHDPAPVPRWEFQEPSRNVLVCRLHTPGAGPGFDDTQLPYLEALLGGLARERKLDRYVAWLYTPMALPLIQALPQPPRALVYDCMDELTAFRCAPPDLPQREAELLRIADVVFAGGPSLYRAKKDRHPNVHCFPSSLDRAHFAQAKDPGIETAEQAYIRRPRLGYFGAIDERVDLALIDAMALAHPEWSIVLVGPVMKVDPASLPRRHNINYFGHRPYADLPAFLAGWDVCLMPFALNAATRFISPTKTLEYMAAEKPIVSTPIRDVVEPYGRIVYSGESPVEFIRTCARALSAPEPERQVRVAMMQKVLSATSWDLTVQAMENQLEAVLAKRRQRNGSSSRVAVIGAGPTGLSAAYHLGEDATLIERNDRVGGWCRSVQEQGFTFDHAGHIMFSSDTYVHELYRILLGDNVRWQDREAWIYSKGIFTRYPFQGSLYGLPPDVIRECLVGAMEARFGKLNAKACPTDSVGDCCADGILESTTPLDSANASGRPQNGARNFEEFIYDVWGAGIAKHFAIPYNRKLWAVPLTEMETSWLGGRVPMPDLEEMIEGALKPSPKPMGPNARFGYPLRGGFEALMNGFVPHLKGELMLNAEVAGISPRRRRIALANGKALSYERLISTMPLPQLIRLMGEEAPEHVRAAAANLRHVSVRCVHLGIGREAISEKHWIYYPEDTVFHRIFLQGNASPHCNPPGGFGLTCEITYSPQKPLPCDGRDLIELCVSDCRGVGLIRPEDPIWAARQVDMPYAYVIYDHARARNVETIREWVSSFDVILAGRYSEWEYYNSDHAFLAGRRAAEQARQSLIETSREMPGERVGVLFGQAHEPG